MLSLLLLLDPLQGSYLIPSPLLFRRPLYYLSPPPFLYPDFRIVRAHVFHFFFLSLSNTCNVDECSFLVSWLQELRARKEFFLSLQFMSEHFLCDRFLQVCSFFGTLFYIYIFVLPIECGTYKFLSSRGMCPFIFPLWYTWWIIEAGSQLYRQLRTR